MGFVLAWGISVLFTTIFQCSPVTAAWDKTIVGAKCFVLADFVIGSNVPNIFADAVIIVLPLPLLWSLKLSLVRKLGLIALFLVAAMLVAHSPKGGKRPLMGCTVPPSSVFYASYSMRELIRLIPHGISSPWLFSRQSKSAWGSAVLVCLSPIRSSAFSPVAGSRLRLTQARTDPVVYTVDICLTCARGWQAPINRRQTPTSCGQQAVVSATC